MTFPLRRRKSDRQEPPLVVVPMTRGGRCGYAVYRDGEFVAWGANETAAMVNAQSSLRCAVA